MASLVLPTQSKRWVMLWSMNKSPSRLAWVSFGTSLWLLNSPKAPLCVGPPPLLCLGVANTLVCPPPPTHPTSGLVGCKKCMWACLLPWPHGAMVGQAAHLPSGSLRWANQSEWLVVATSTSGLGRFLWKRIGLLIGMQFEASPAQTPKIAAIFEKSLIC